MRRTVSAALASAFLAGPWTRRELSARARSALGVTRARWLGKLVGAVLKRWPEASLHDAHAEEENGLNQEERREEPRGGVDAREERHVIGHCGPHPVPSQEGTSQAIMPVAP